MIISADLKNSIKIIGLCSLQVYRVAMGTMLSMFVPQKCNEDVCTLTENFNNDELFHQVVFFFNSITLLFFIVNYCIELKREYWCIKYLDIDANKSDNSLKQIIKNEPKLDHQMDRFNTMYYQSCIITLVMYICNALLSIKLVNDNYYNSSTVNSFLTFVLLISLKLYNAVVISYNSVKHDKMMSAFLSEFTSYNVLDDDYLKSKLTIRP